MPLKRPYRSLILAAAITFPSYHDSTSRGLRTHSYTALLHHPHSYPMPSKLGHVFDVINAANLRQQLHRETVQTTSRGLAIIGLRCAALGVVFNNDVGA